MIFQESTTVSEREMRWRFRSRAALAVMAMVVSSLIGEMVVAVPAQADAGQTAIAWAQVYLGTSYDDGYCLEFVASAYSAAGVSIGGADTAADYWDNNPEGFTEHPGDTSPPVGALVFWGPDDVDGYSNPAGHVGIYVGAVSGVGSDEVISTWSWPEPSSQPDVHYFSLSGRNNAGYPYLGWMAPAGSAGAGPPANGSFVQVSGSSAIYEIAGGAPLYVSSWSAVGGSQPYTVISQQQFNALNEVPSNGTLIRDAATGAIWIVAGGAPLYVSSCSAIDTCSGVINIDPWDVQNVGNPAAHLNAVPANGTLIRDKTSGAIWIVAGGAPLYVSSCSAIDTCSGAVDVDPYAVTNFDHLNAVPSNGTLIRDKTSGAIWIVAGGAPLYVSSCSAIDTCTGVVDVDPYAVSHLDHLNSVPANGTYIRDKTTGQIWRIAGGAPFAISTCQYLNGCPGPVDVDPYAVTHLDHLSATPVNGTIVEGVPSDIYWSFSGGLRSAASPNSSATAVDDAGLDAFPEPTVPAPEPPAGSSGTAPGAASSSSPGVTSSGGGTAAPNGGSAVAASCVVPRLEHLTLTQARRALSRGRCELGTMHRPRHVRSGAVLRVVSQSLRPGTKHQANYRVSVTLR